MMSSVTVMMGEALGGLGFPSCHFSAQPQGHPEMLTTHDPLADTVDIRAELGRVLETVHLSGLLVAPAVLEAAAGAGGGGQGESMGEG